MARFKRAVANLAVKLDVDTLRGYRGVPGLLDLWAARMPDAKMSVFFSFGPDNSGKAIRRIFRKGFISKMMRTKAPSTYGWRTLLYGTLLPAPPIVPSDTKIFERACGEGHDCGVHAWDHVLVQDKLPSISEGEFLELYGRAADLFEKLSGSRPESYAAPGWQVSPASLSALDGLGLKYASDTRGYSPFIPEYGGKKFRTPQIPTTLPTMDEMLGRQGIDDDTLPDLWLRGLKHDWNVITIHAEMEGISKLNTFDLFLKKAKDAGVTFVTLREVVECAVKSAGEIVHGELPGRAGTVAMQA
ncbi:MAG: 4-deoxy-4-formamido-L-arabinose-phosphoundecaprenol deformylase [Synergistaceae bacterium]|nr:4-deoxy-4-formamido-L-arabinose-phosphoundecaprenol deformylase [Synergistaceae bacterium]